MVEYGQSPPWSLVKKVQMRGARRKRERRRTRQYVGASITSATKQMGLFTRLLRNGIGSSREAQKIPADQQQNTDKFRQRWRDMKQSAP
jgi:hypothetical protein